MAEQITLTQSLTTDHWRVQALTLARGLSSVEGGSIVASPAASSITVVLIGPSGRTKRHTWSGAGADADIVALNKANLTSNSLEKRILNRLIADGVIAGAVAGSPD